MRSQDTPDALPSRKFGVLDGMICIGAIACAIAFGSRDFASLLQQMTGLINVIAEHYGFSSTRHYGPPQFRLRSMSSYSSAAVWYLIRVSETLILSMAPVVLLTRSRRPRPPIRALLRQPGTVAALSVIAGSVIVSGWLHLLFFGRIIDGTVKTISAGGTVALAWAGMALTKRWNPEHSWMDRLGRLVGVAAILAAVLAFWNFGI